MDFIDVCKKRRSVHDFLLGNKISDEEFRSIMQSVQMTPSGYNAQPWEFILIRDEKKLQELSSVAYDQEHIILAGNAVVVIGNQNFGQDESERICQEWQQFRNLTPEKLDGLRSSLTKERDPEKTKIMALRNCSLAAMTFLYSATNAGWATCPMMGFRYFDMVKLFKPSRRRFPVLLIALGKEDVSKTPEQLPRKSLETIIHYEEYTTHP